MLQPLTDKTTRLSKISSAGSEVASVQLSRSRLSEIRLPPHRLYDLLSKISLRRAQINSERTTPKKDFVRAGRYKISKSETPPKRKLDDRVFGLKRPCSAGRLYDSSDVEKISKDFLRLFSRAIVREMSTTGNSQRLLPNNTEALANSEILAALDPVSVCSPVALTKSESHSKSSCANKSFESKIDLTNQFNDSLSLPSGNRMITPIISLGSGTHRSLRVRQDYDFMKYLDHAAKGSGNIFQKDYTSVFESEASTPRSRHEPSCHSLSGTGFMGLCNDLDWAVLQSRLIHPVLDIVSSEETSVKTESSGQVLKYDGLASVEFRLHASGFGPEPNRSLSKSFTDSPLFLKRSVLDAAKELELLRVSSPLTSTNRITTGSCIVTPPRIRSRLSFIKELDFLFKSDIKKNECPFLTLTATLSEKTNLKEGIKLLDSLPNSPRPS